MAGKNLTEVIGLSVEDNARMVHGIMKTFNAPPIDLTDVKAVEQRINDYFAECAASGLRPGNLGMYASLGMSKQEYHNMVTGKNKTKVSPACIDLIKKAARAIGVYREGLALEGKINPVTYIFMGKNYDGLQDQTQIEVTSAAQTPVTITAEEARAALVEMDTDLEAED